MAMARGGQILLTRPVFDNARQVLKGEELAAVGPLAWVSHGDYELKGVEDLVEICEVGEQNWLPFAAPPSTEKSRRHVAVEGEPVVGWRPAVGQQVPKTKWTLQQQLGAGGFGEVWLAEHETLKERRVFKFCFRTDRVRALRREVTLFRLLKEQLGDHPQIVSLREVCFDEPPFYVVMDYAEGGDLRAWCDAQGGVGKVPEASRLELIAQAAEALDAAHRCGVVHRDIKPGNILIARSPGHRDSPMVKLTDFGIGQVAAKELLDKVTQAGFTQTMLGSGGSHQTGTYLYMAPELLAGRSATAQSDIYSLGVVFFQMLVGDFGRPLTTDWARNVKDPLFREDLLKCVAGDPAERFTTAGDLARSLRRVKERRVVLAEKEALGERNKRRQYRLGLLGRAALALLVLALLISGFSLLREYRAGRFGSVEVRTFPQGAEVWVNEAKVGTTPYTAEKLPPGKRSFTLKLSGYQTLQTEIDVSAGKQTQLVSFLRPSTGELLQAKSEPAPAAGVTNAPVLTIAASISNRMTVVAVAQDVRVLRKGSSAWVVARPKMVLSPGDRIKTGAASKATLRLPDNCVVIINELTDFQLEPAGSMSLQRGSIQGNSTNLIRLPTGVARIRG